MKGAQQTHEPQVFQKMVKQNTISDIMPKEKSFVFSTTSIFLQDSIPKHPNQAIKLTHTIFLFTDWCQRQFTSIKPA